VLAEPRRRQILDLVRDGECSVNELVSRLAMNQPAVSKHLRVLREAGLVWVRVDEQRRLYRLSPAPLRELDRWLAPYRAAWDVGDGRQDRRELFCAPGKPVTPARLRPGSRPPGSPAPSG
jgi:DNA-binding transcriptional ArsR family regulator